MSGADTPMGSMYDGAVAQHELYLSWVKAGFTPEQSLELVKAVIEAVLERATNG